MTATIVHKGQFSGLSHIFGRDNNHLAALLRGMAIDNARSRVEAAAVAAITDSTTGTADSTIPWLIVDLPIAPTGVFNATSAGGVQLTAFNTSLGKIANDHAVLAERLNQARGRFGLPLVTFASGTIATSGTLAALDLTATTASGNSAVDNASYVAATTTMKQAHRQLVRAFHEILAALGFDADLIDDLVGTYPQTYALPATATVVAAASGASSVALADGTAFLADVANNLATLAVAWNQIMTGAGLTALTDNTTGTASDQTVNTVGTFTPFTSVATDCAPKAGFDTLLGVWRNASASVAARINLIAEQHGLAALLTDSTTGTASTTLAAQAALTAVTGTTVCLDVVSGLVALNDEKNNVATIAAAINKLVPFYGVTALTDDSGGTASVTTPPTLVATPTTATGVSGALLSSVANAEATTDIGEIANAYATFAKALNAMLGAGGDYQPLNVVAGLT